MCKIVSILDSTHMVGTLALKISIQLTMYLAFPVYSCFELVTLLTATSLPLLYAAEATESTPSASACISFRQ